MECFRLAPFLRALGEAVFPHFTWGIMRGVRHAFAYGTDAAGTIKIIFDILFFKFPAIELIDLATQKYRSPRAIAADTRCAAEANQKESEVALTE
jgi:hypothetical protein